MLFKCDGCGATIEADRCRMVLERPSSGDRVRDERLGGFDLCRRCTEAVLDVVGAEQSKLVRR